MNRITIAQRLWLWALLATSLFFAAVGLGWHGLYEARESLRTTHEVRFATLQRLDVIQKTLHANRRLVLLAFQLDPEGSLASAHSQSLQYYLDAIDRNTAETGRLWAEYSNRIADAEERTLATAFDESYRVWLEELDAVTATLRIGRFHLSYMTSFVAAGESAGEAASRAIEELYAHQARATAADYRAAETRYRMTISVYLALAVIGVLLGSLTAFSTLRRLRNAFRVASNTTKSIAAGDLSQTVPILGCDELGQLLAEVSVMRDNLHRLVDDLRRQVEQLGAKANDLNAVAANASSVASEQAEAVRGMSTAAAGLTRSIDQVESHVSASLRITAEAAGHSGESAAYIHSLAEEFRSVAEIVMHTAERVRETEAFSKQIGSIVHVIREVAEQTNLLALNAAIEAARAGDQGRGFAVVADEVRKLAERTSNATTEITTTIGNIQAGSRAAFSGMEAAVARVQDGAVLAGKAGESVAGIRAGTERVIRAVGDIGGVLNEQAAATREIARRVDGVSEGTSELSASAAHCAASAAGLDALAKTLDMLSARFRLA
uniref:HAMP domain-containing protein n=1 Tax=Aromatoleum anaerobium TaxID=182180 RepID=A0ABX1PNY2_9RHOO